MNRNSGSGPDISGGIPRARASESLDCASVRDIIPLLDHSHDTGAEIEGVRAHLTGCMDCMDELRIVRGVRATAPPPPPGFASAVMFRLGTGEGSPAISAGIQRSRSPMANPGRRPSLRRPRIAWGLSAAAMIVLALGVGSLWSEANAPDTGGLVALLLASSDADPAEEWMVAGAPYLDALSDEMLRNLLQDLES